MNSKGSMGAVSARSLATASVAALIAAAAAFAVPHADPVTATAIVAVDEPSAALRLAAARGAADLAASKSVAARATASLIGTEMSTPEPTWLDRLGVTIGAVKPKSAAARLGDALDKAVTAQPGDGLIEIRAVAPDPATATRYATAVAEALVAEEDIAASAALHRRETAAADRLDTLRVSVRVARERLASLGATETDPAEALLAATTATRAAESHLAAVRAVIAAGSPPLGAGTDLPASVAVLQGTYWDLRKQFDKATETLGDRHTTVIALRDGVARAAASLGTEWGKIERAAAGALDVARSREAVLRKTMTNPDSAKQATVDDARRMLRRANAALAAPGPVASAAVAMPFRLVSSAVPTEQRGGSVSRPVLAAGVGALAFVLALLPFSRRRRADLARVETDVLDVSGGPSDALPAAYPEEDFASAGQGAGPDTVPSAVPPRSAGPSEQSEPVRVAVDAGADITLSAAQARRQELPESDVAAASTSETVEPRHDAVPRVHASLTSELRNALRGLATSLEGAAAATPGLPSVMVAANAAGVDTGRLALAFGELAAELGFRVLLIEAERSRPMLAASVAADGEPVLVEAFDALRVALPAEATAGLFLAPALREGARLAAALARNTQATIIEDLAAAFDLLVVDGGRAAEALAGGFGADRYLRVGTSRSAEENDRFLATLGAEPATLLGVVADGTFFAHEPAAPRREAIAGTEPRAAARLPASDTLRRRTAPPTAGMRSAPRRRVVAR